MHYKTTATILALASAALAADISPSPVQEGTQDGTPTNSVTVEAKDYTFTKATLPAGGKFLQDPQNNNIQYYWAYVPSPIITVLYASTDGGAVWKPRSHGFPISQVFIHPKTGVLYAVVRDGVLTTGSDGYTRPASAEKIIMSADGRQWKDITPLHDHFPQIMSIFQDPDNPNRVCFFEWDIRGNFFQAVDDEYSVWKSFRAGQWENRKKEPEKEK
jgi:hypothetical protein